MQHNFAAFFKGFEKEKTKVKSFHNKNALLKQIKCFYLRRFQKSNLSFPILFLQKVTFFCIFIAFLL